MYWSGPTVQWQQPMSTGRGRFNRQGDSPCTSTIPPTPSGLPCNGQDRQYSGSSLCQQAGGTGLSPLQYGSSRSVCLQGDSSLPNVLLPGEGQPTTRDGRSGSPVASRPAVCLSPFQPSPPPLMEDPARECGGDLGGPKLASHAMVLRHCTTLERDSLGAPYSERPAAAGTRHPVSPLPTGRPVTNLCDLRRQWCPHGT